MRTLVIADSDSRAKWANSLAESIQDKAHEISTIIIVTGSTPNESQLVAAGVTSFEYRTMYEFLETGFDQEYDNLILSTAGTSTFLCIWAFSREGLEKFPGLKSFPRPVIITGYVGLVLGQYIAGLSWREGSDLILVPSLETAEIFKEYKKSLKLVSLVEVVPLSFLKAAVSNYRTSTKAPSENGFTVSFAAQAQRPASYEQRRYLAAQLVRYAIAHPQHRLIIKLRNLPGEQSTHFEAFDYPSLIKAELSKVSPGKVLPNLEFQTGSMVDSLKQSDLCLTVSSTAALEAMAMGIPTGVISDFGVTEALGNHIFAGSGCLIGTEEVLRGQMPTEPDANWMQKQSLTRNLILQADSAFHQHLRELQMLRSFKELPPTLPFYSLTSTPWVVNDAIQRSILNESLLSKRSFWGKVAHSPKIFLRIGLRNLKKFIMKNESRITRWLSV